MKTKNISRINQLVLQGLLTEDKDLFLNRLNVIISRCSNDILQQLAEGVIVGVKIADEQAALAYLTDRNSCNNWKVIAIISIEITSDNRINIRYKYEGRTRWFTTEEKANKFSMGYSVSEGVSDIEDEKHPFKGVYTSTSSDNCDVKDWMEIEIL